MKQTIKLLLVMGLLCGCLCACGSENMTQSDKYWIDAQSTKSLEDYLADEGAYLDWETVRREAENEELSMQQQFRSVLLLCAYEYQCVSGAYDTELSYYQQSTRNDEFRMFQIDYPDSSPYANNYLKKVNTAKDEFWDAFVVVFEPCEYYIEALIAAADELDEQTIFNLLEGLNENQMWGIRLKMALMKWVCVHPEETQDYIEALQETDYYQSFTIYEWQRAHSGNYAASNETKSAKKRLPAWTDFSRNNGTLKIVIIVLGVFFVMWGTPCFLGAVFLWDKYSQHPEFFPFAKRRRWQIDVHGWLYEAYGDKAVRTYVLFTSLIIVAMGIWFPCAFLKDNAERGQVNDYQRVRQGETVSFAGGDLILEEVEISEGFMAKRFNLDNGRYEEVEVEADMSDEDMLLIRTTLTNNSGSSLNIDSEALQFYAKPVDEGNNINGHVVADGLLYHSDVIELAAGESIPVWFWISLTEEEQKQPHMFVFQYGRTGCVIRLG